MRDDMALVRLTTPIDEATVRSLHVGDTVSITGRLYTGRDAVHHRIHTGTKPPVDLEGQIIYHCLHAIGGAAQVCAASVKRVDGVDWMDLGSPEAIWHLWVEEFMAIVTMDAHGQSLHEQVLAESRERLAALKA